MCGIYRWLRSGYHLCAAVRLTEISKIERGGLSSSSTAGSLLIFQSQPEIGMLESAGGLSFAEIFERVYTCRSNPFISLLSDIECVHWEERIERN